MHACMQFDVYLSDPHYTEKVAICCGEQKISGFRGVVRLRECVACSNLINHKMRGKIPFDPHIIYINSICSKHKDLVFR